MCYNSLVSRTADAVVCSLGAPEQRSPGGRKLFPREKFSFFVFKTSSRRAPSKRPVAKHCHIIATLGFPYADPASRPVGRPKIQYPFLSSRPCAVPHAGFALHGSGTRPVSELGCRLSSDFSLQVSSLSSCRNPDAVFRLGLPSPISDSSSPHPGTRCLFRR